ncbi:transposase [Streptomyces indonesiensis]
MTMKVFCGIDWASDHHDVALVDQDGALLARGRIGDDAAGLHQLLDLLTTHGDTEEAPIPVAIETSRGLLVACLRATKRPVYAINPMAAARYRDRHAVARKKSDHLDAMILANILRTDAAAHRPSPTTASSPRPSPSWPEPSKTPSGTAPKPSNKLRSHLRAYFPGFLTATQPLRDGLSSPIARTLLAAAPTPAQAAKLTRAQLRTLLAKAGRKRGIDTEADRLHTALRAPQMQQLPLVEQAMGHQTTALLRQLEAACTSADNLAQATVASFDTHPDAEIITSFPGLGALTGARVLAEIGDDRSRFTDAKGLKAFAGAAPVTRASGRSVAVLARRVKNQRLASAYYVWAFSALTASPGARAHYDRRRKAKDRHTAAQRNLFNRLLGCLHHCLTHGIHYDEATAFPAPTSPAIEAAA